MALVWNTILKTQRSGFRTQGSGHKDQRSKWGRCMLKLKSCFHHQMEGVGLVRRWSIGTLPLPISSLHDLIYVVTCSAVLCPFSPFQHTTSKLYVLRCTGKVKTPPIWVCIEANSTLTWRYSLRITVSHRGKYESDNGGGPFITGCLPGDTHPISRWVLKRAWDSEL